MVQVSQLSTFHGLYAILVAHGCGQCMVLFRTLLARRQSLPPLWGGGGGGGDMLHTIDNYNYNYKKQREINNHYDQKLYSSISYS